MQIYELRPDLKRYRGLFVDLGVKGLQQRFDGRHRLREGWVTPPARALKRPAEYSRNHLPLGDFISPGLVTIAIGAKAYDGLADLLEDHCELLPVRYEEPLWLINVLDVRDCLDRSLSDIEYHVNSTTRAMFIRRYRFYEEKLAGATFFKIPELTFRIFITEVVATRIDSLGLEGARLIEVGTGELVPLV